MGWLWDGYSLHGRARQRNELLHSIRPPAPTAKATGVDKLRPLHKELGSGTERRNHDGDNDDPPRNYNDIRAGMVGVSEA